ncbi:MAG: enoyl-CoA hydratase/isomerase family protein [Bdellovibrionales bacterium]|nr:enoyl-CoA hydratase/isomerase family protein [Bdellovibrionales bacterium]
MVASGTIEASVKDGVGEICFFHPKGNSLPGELLRGLASQVDKFGEDSSVKVVLLKSQGDRAFCAGASFDEFLAIDDLEGSRNFFSGFAHLILAMRRCPKFVVARVQGKVVGGGVGIAAAADYALATVESSVRLSELALGIGPFIIGPAVRRKMGMSAFGQMAVDADWHDSAWAREKGLFAEVYPDIDSLDKGVVELMQKLTEYNPEAMEQLKTVLWEGTEDWEELVHARVEVTARLVLTDFVKNTVSKIKNR